MSDSSKQNVNSNQICGSIIAFKEKNAKVKLDQGEQIILWPIKSLPDGVNEGTKVYLRISSEDSIEKERVAVARKILEELVN